MAGDRGGSGDKPCPASAAVPRPRASRAGACPRPRGMPRGQHADARGPTGSQLLAWASAGWLAALRGPAWARAEPAAAAAVTSGHGAWPPGRCVCDKGCVRPWRRWMSSEKHDVKKYPSCSTARTPTYRITESQNGRGWKGPLWVTQSNPPAQAGSPRAGCTGPCPGGS